MSKKVEKVGGGGERTVDIESVLVHAEAVIQTVATLGNGALICKELADEAVTALKVIPAIRAELKRTAKPKMTAEHKDLLDAACKSIAAACKSLAADVERAKEITCNAEYVLREMCKSCGQTEACKKHLYGLPKINCRMAAIMGVSIGMIQEDRKATLETTWELLHGQMAALKAEQKGGAK